MIRLMIEKKNIREGLRKPCEGIFWIIDGELISYANPIGFNASLEHKKIWNDIKGRYGNVPFDYYPRGRVMTNEVRNSDGTLVGYRSFIYIDDCINTEDIIDEIKYCFRLTGDNCEIAYVGSDGGITSNYYKCHNCK